MATTIDAAAVGTAPAGDAAAHTGRTLRAAAASATTEARDPEVGLGRAYVVGSAIGFVAVFIVCGGIALLGGVEPGAALGAAAFTGFWGGPGFGGMLGAVLHLERDSDH